MTQFTISVEGTDEDVESLWDWLRRESELRGRVARRIPPPDVGAMGSVTELVVGAVVGGVVQTAVGHLGQALAGWLTRSRPGRARDAVLIVTTPDGHTVRLTAGNAGSAVRLMEGDTDTPPSGWAPDADPTVPG
jgi:hypothetical protein